MAKTLAELRESPHVGLPERSYPICLAGKLLAEFEDLDEQFQRALEAEESAGPRKRVGSKSKAKTIAEQLEKLRDEMEEHTVTVKVRARQQGEWRRWCEEHPAREDSDKDTKVFLGICNADDLVDDLGTYVVAINGEEPKDGDWAFVAANAVDGDKDGLAKIVASMHAGSVDIPKSRLTWLNNLRRETASE